VRENPEIVTRLRSNDALLTEIVFKAEGDEPEDMFATLVLKKGFHVPGNQSVSKLNVSAATSDAPETDKPKLSETGIASSVTWKIEWVLSFVDAVQITNYLGASEYVRIISFDGLIIGGIALKHLSEWMRENPHILGLRFNRCKLKKKNILESLAFLSQNPFILELVLATTFTLDTERKLLSEITSSVVNLLEQNRTIETFHLTDSTVLLKGMPLFLAALQYNTSLLSIYFGEDELTFSTHDQREVKVIVARNQKLKPFKNIEKKFLHDDAIEAVDLAACDFEFIDKTILEATSLPDSQKKQSYLSELQRLRMLALAVRDDNVEMKLSALGMYLPTHLSYGLARSRMYDFYLFSHEETEYKVRLQACLYAMQSRHAGCKEAPDIDFLLHEIKVRIFKLENSSFNLEDLFVAGLKWFLIDYIYHERQHEGTAYSELSWPLLVECLSEPLEIGLAEMEARAKESDKGLSHFLKGFLLDVFQKKFKLAFDEKTQQIQELKLQQALADFEDKLKQVISLQPPKKRQFSDQHLVAFMEDLKQITNKHLQPDLLETTFKAFKKTHQALWDSVNNHSQLKGLLLTILSYLYHPLDEQARKQFRNARKLNASSLFFKPMISNFYAIKRSYCSGVSLPGGLSSINYFL